VTGLPKETGDDAALIEGMRRKETTALRAFFLRFYPPLIDQATRMGVPLDRRDEIVTEFMDDVALWLMNERHRAPRVLVTYLSRGLKHRILNRVRGEVRRRRVYESAATETAGTSERHIDSSLSTAAVRAADGSGSEEDRLSPRLRHVAGILDGAVTERERELALWMANRIGPTEIGRRLGISREAAKARMHRLRRKLCGIVVSSAVTAEDRRELLAFFGDVRRLSPLDRRLLIGERDVPPDAA
jgi:DNA-directed RNA polymerase specialized sigma24 family protein